MLSEENLDSVQEIRAQGFDRGSELHCLGWKIKKVLRSSLAAAVYVVQVHFADADVRFQVTPPRDRKCGQKNTVFKKFEKLPTVSACLVIRCPCPFVAFICS